MQFGVGFLPFRAGTAVIPRWSIPPAGGRRGIPAVPVAPVVPVPGVAVSASVARAGSRYDCVPPPPKAPVTGLGTSYDWPLSPPPLGSAAESPF